ncbi:MAG: hypothetical protein GEU68_05495 [Actinobacteria bacterium]|nr:hypothetical protein [Actinomycetota bacterium]
MLLQSVTRLVGYFSPDGVSSDDYPCNDNGQNCKGKIYARSVAGVTPSRYITWFQAQQALANSGKRLPTGNRRR